MKALLILLIPMLVFAENDPLNLKKKTLSNPQKTGAATMKGGVVTVPIKATYSPFSSIEKRNIKMEIETTISCDIKYYSEDLTDCLNDENYPIADSAPTEEVKGGSSSGVGK